MQPVTGARRGGDGFVANKVIEVLSAALGREMAGRTSTAGEERGLVRYGRTARARPGATGSGLGRDGGRENEGRGIIAGKTWAEPVRCCLREGCYRSIPEATNLTWRSQCRCAHDVSDDDLQAGSWLLPGLGRAGLDLRGCDVLVHDNGRRLVCHVCDGVAAECSSCVEESSVALRNGNGNWGIVSRTSKVAGSRRPVEVGGPRLRLASSELHPCCGGSAAVRQERAPPDYGGQQKLL